MNEKRGPVLVVAAVIRHPSQDGRVLIVRRGPGQSGAGHWEFPGGKVEAGEMPESALVREIDEELGIAIEVQDYVGEADFTYPSKTIRLRVYWAQARNAELDLREHDALEWLQVSEIQPEKLSAADRPFVKWLLGK
ncbi:MAG: (deoxy)nucleoside triphosphate pyrophosphohydrolase [Bdellovibrio sp.]|nr:(deoxy)nucleoside triphosphate pyrophosphohydrolase [Bdellovibrio sp.]